MTIPPPAMVERINAFAGDYYRAFGDPGIAVVVMNDRGVVSCRAFGVTRSGRPFSCDEPAPVASLTKSVTAIAVMQLVEQHRIRLDDPVQRYLPWFLVDGKSAPITVREVLQMRSGIDTSTGLKWLASYDTSPDALQRRVRDLRYARLFAPPGTAFAYSNANYDIAGAIVEAVTGTTYEQYILHRVLRPIAVDAGFGPRPTIRGYSRWFGVPVPSIFSPPFVADSPAAGLVMTPRALGRYYAAHLDSGRTWSRAILTAKGFETIHYSPPGSPYAMGWFESFLQDRERTLRHDGDAADFRSYVMILPTRRYGVSYVVNANQVPDSGRGDALDTAFAHIITNREVMPPPRIPPTLFSRTALLLLAIVAILGIFKTPATRFALTIRVAIASLVIAAFVWIGYNQMGTPLVGFVFAPDLTTIMTIIAGAMAVQIAIALYKLVVGATER